MAKYAFIKFKINNDFDSWEQAFYAHQPIAREAGILELFHAKQRQHLVGKVRLLFQAPNFGYLETNILLTPLHKKFHKKDLAGISRTCQ